MGMFDEVVYPVPCPYCGRELRGWQSKSAGCSLATLTPAELWEQRRSDAYDQVGFYSNCDTCGTWVEIRLHPGSLPLTDRDYEQMRRREPVTQRSGPARIRKRLGDEERGTQWTWYVPGDRRAGSATYACQPSGAWLYLPAGSSQWSQAGMEADGSVVAVRGQFIEVVL